MQLSQLSGGVAAPAGGAAAGGGTGTVGGGAVGMTNKSLPLNQRLQLQREPWFHGAISRKEAEMLLRQVGGGCVGWVEGVWSVLKCVRVYGVCGDGVCGVCCARLSCSLSIVITTHYT